jgi:hypothetical protein
MTTSHDRQFFHFLEIQSKIMCSQFVDFHIRMHNMDEPNHDYQQYMQRDENYTRYMDYQKHMQDFRPARGSAEREGRGAGGGEAVLARGGQTAPLPRLEQNATSTSTSRTSRRRRSRTSRTAIPSRCWRR